MNSSEPLYFDYHATTPCDEKVLKEMKPYFKERFGNTSSTHKIGFNAAKVFNKAKLQVAGLIGATSEEITLTSGATEANNIILQGLNLKSERNEILISALEHDSVLNSIPYLKSKGFIVKIIPSTADGFITTKALERLISDKTLLVSVMTANHEIGTIQPIKELAKIAKEFGSYFHSDASQAIRNIPINVNDLNIDFLSLSAHKFYGPGGIGALYVRSKPPIKLSPLMFGGSQQKLRPGTIPLALAAGIGKASALIKEKQIEENKLMEALSKLFKDELNNYLPEAKINGSLSNRLPGSFNIYIPDINAQDLLLSLSNELCLSTGSACGSKNKAPSSVLKAIGLNDDEIYGSIRISMGNLTNKNDIIYLLEKLKKEVDGQSSMEKVQAYS
jgi:cysteine desulfurase